MTRERDTFDFMDDNQRRRDRFGDSETVRSNDTVRSDLTDVKIAIHPAPSPKALLVSIDGNEARAVWLPLSQIEIHYETDKIDGVERNGRIIERNVATVTLPTWLAKAKGLI